MDELYSVEYARFQFYQNSFQMLTYTLGADAAEDMDGDVCYAGN